MVAVVPGGGRSTSSLHRGLWSHSPVREYPLTFGNASAPPEQLDRKGVPALLSSDPGVKREYLAALARRLPAVTPPVDVGFSAE